MERTVTYHFEISKCFLKLFLSTFSRNSQVTEAEGREGGGRGRAGAVQEQGGGEAEVRAGRVRVRGHVGEIDIVIVL